MNTSSDHSGACESGWTRYLDQLPSSEDECNRSMPVDTDSRRKGVDVNEDEEDEDSSMLSDASSGPPHFHQDEDRAEEIRYNSSTSASEQKQGKHKKKAKEHWSNQQDVHLDDTASSPVQRFSKASDISALHSLSVMYNAYSNIFPQEFIFQDNAVPKKDEHLPEQGSGFSQGFSATHSKSKSVPKKRFGFLKSSNQNKSK